MPLPIVYSRARLGIEFSLFINFLNCFLFDTYEVTILMIKSFIHKGLQRFYETGSVAGIQSKHANRLRLILTNLTHARTPGDMDLPGLFMHKLKGDRKDTWSVRVSGNWRLTYRFVGQHVEIVNYEDYH